MKDYIELFKSEPTFRRLSIIQLIAYFGAWFSNIAIYTLLSELNTSASVIAFVAMLHFLAGVIQAPFSGSIIDSFKPKKILLVLIIIETFATFFLIFVTSVDDMWLLYLLIFLKMAAASFYFTTEMSLLPKMLRGKKLQKANEIHSIIWSLSYTLGMAISGFFVYYFGVKVAFIVDAMMFVVCFILLYNLKIEINIIKTDENLFEMIKDTFRYIKRTPQAMHLMIIHAFVGLTAFDALVVLMANQYYASIIATSLALGLLHSARAVGLVIGPMLINRWVNNKTLVYVFMAQAVAIWFWAFLMRDFYLSLFASVFVGFFTTTLWSYTYTLLQKNITEKYYGRMLAYNDMLFLSAAALVSFMIGFLATHEFSLQTIAALMGVGFVLGGLYYRWIIKTQTIKDASDD